MPVDNAGDTLSSSRAVYLTPNTQTFTDWLGGADNNDFYRFTLQLRSSLNLNLDGLSADCDVQLIHDANGNGVKDLGEVISFSMNNGTTAESINTFLDAGTYFIRVYPRSNQSSRYNLSVSATPADYGGNSLNNPFKIGISSITSIYKDWIGSSDTSDYYEFNLNSTSTFNLLLNGLTNNANVALLNANGDRVAISANSGTSDETINSTLESGVYYVHVSRQEGDTYYNLSLSATPVSAQTRITPVSANTVTPPPPASITPPPSANNPPAASTTPRVVQGTLQADTFSWTSGYNRTVFFGNGNIEFSSGKRDLLDLSSFSSANVTINYANTSNGGVLFNAGNGTRLFDSIRFVDGTDILFAGVEKIRFADTTVDLSIVPNDPQFSQQWNLHMMGVQNAWRFTTGSSGVLIGIGDTGLGVNNQGNIHPDLRVATTKTISNNYKDELSSYSNTWFSHGSLVQGVIAAASNNGVGMSGINWNSPVYNIDVIDTDGLAGADTGDYTLVSGIEAMIAEANSKGQRAAINLSLSGGYSTALEQLIARNQNNAVFVIAAGNQNNSTISSPADLAAKYGNVIAVGAVWGSRDWYGNATTPGDRISYANWWGSNYGNGLTLMAPSEIIATSATSTTANGNVAFGYDSRFNGTSAAVPEVTGVASLLWSVNPSLTAVQIKAIVSETAYDLGRAGYDNVYGYGLINADNAVRRALAFARDSRLLAELTTPTTTSTTTSSTAVAV
ncbi:MAG: S8 family serine peptidase [Nostocaceae cyanobacterium]|nr:S8 family serine peptidase [Nostocaceae cyanobacterium]